MASAVGRPVTSGADELRVQLAHAIRAASGLGLSDVGGIMHDAQTSLGGDHVLAALARHAHGFAISVGSIDPAMTQEEARRAWDLRWAASARGSQPPGHWDEVERLSAEMATRRQDRGEKR